MRTSMCRSGRSLAPAVVSVLLVLSCSRPAGPIAAVRGEPVTRGPLTLVPIVFAQTDDALWPSTVEAEEGWLRVPARHGAPGTDSLTIHFVRFPSTASDPGPPIVYLAGGPGGSGTLSASGDRFDLFQRMRAAGDVIALDQRGVRYTDAFFLCPGSWEYPIERPADPAVLAAVLGPYVRRCHDQLADSLDLAALTTWESAEDLDDLRAALGAEQLVLWGISYGTHLGLAYLRQHPDRVARAILAGVEGPDHTYKLPANLDRILRRVDSAMAADPRARARVPDFAGAVRGLLDRLRDEPAQVAVTDEATGGTHTVVLGPLDVQRALFLTLGEREDIEELLLRAIPLLEGDFSALGRLVYQSRRGGRALVMSIAMDCASSLSAERAALIAEQAATALLDDVGNLTLRAACAAWPGLVLPDAFRAPVAAAVPVLFISGTLDARTPPVNAEEVRAGFPNSHHLRIEGGSHDDDLFLSSPRIVDAMLAFLRGDMALPDRVILPPLRFRLP